MWTSLSEPDVANSFHYSDFQHLCWLFLDFQKRSGVQLPVGKLVGYVAKFVTISEVHPAFEGLLANLAKRHKKLLGCSIYEACGTDDRLFKTGFVRGSSRHRVVLSPNAVRECFAQALSAENADALTRTHKSSSRRKAGLLTASGKSTMKLHVLVLDKQLRAHLYLVWS